MGLGVALKRALIRGSKLSATPIRFFLLADVLADLLQLEPEGGHGVSTSPEVLAP